MQTLPTLTCVMLNETLPTELLIAGVVFNRRLIPAWWVIAPGFPRFLFLFQKFSLLLCVFRMHRYQLLHDFVKRLD